MFPSCFSRLHMQHDMAPAANGPPGTLIVAQWDLTAHMQPHQSHRRFQWQQHATEHAEMLHVDVQVHVCSQPKWTQRRFWPGARAGSELIQPVNLLRTDLLSHTERASVESHHSLTVCVCSSPALLGKAMELWNSEEIWPQTLPDDWSSVDCCFDKCT